MIDNLGHFRLQDPVCLQPLLMWNHLHNHEQLLRRFSNFLEEKLRQISDGSALEDQNQVSGRVVISLGINALRFVIVYVIFLRQLIG